MRLADDAARRAGGWLALGFVLAIAGGGLVSLALAATVDGGSFLAAFASPRLIDIVGFTLWQAALSTLISVAMALPLALALADERRFFGREALLRLFALPLALPALAGALGVLAVFGQNGVVAWLFSMAGLPSPDIYGLPGILIAHVFFNLPLTARILLSALETIPVEYRAQAAALGLPRPVWFVLVEWSALRRPMAGAAALVFMLCMTSFVIVLTLGGGPAATTLEVAIYQALAFDFDIAAAVALTVTHLALAAIVFLLLRQQATATGSQGWTVAKPGRIALPRTRSVTMLQRLAIVLGAVFVLSPVLALVLRGVAGGPAQLLARADVQGAVATSIVLGLVSALLATVSALALSAAHEAARRRVGGRSGVFGYATGAGANLVFAMPPLAIAAGWFVGIRLIADPWAFGAPLVASVNAMMALPFAIRFVQPAFDAAAARHNRLCAALGLFGWRRFAVVDWPAMRRPLATAFAFSMALGIGDLGVIALFGSDDLRTLPFLILQRMGSYRTADAAGLTLVLIVLVLALVWLADRLSAGEGEKQ